MKLSLHSPEFCWERWQETSVGAPYDIKECDAFNTLFQRRSLMSLTVCPRSTDGALTAVRIRSWVSGFSPYIILPAGVYSSNCSTPVFHQKNNTGFPASLYSSFNFSNKHFVSSHLLSPVFLSKGNISVSHDFQA